MEEVRYESGLAQLPGFQPKKRARFDKQRQAFAAQAERDQRQQLETIRQNTEVDVVNARQSGKDVEALAQFSTSLNKQLIEGQKKRNEEEKQKGIMDVYENGMDTTSFDAGVEELKEVDRQTEAVAAKMEDNGADVFLSNRVRNASGWRAYGQVIGKAQLGAANYPAYLEAAKLDTEVIITDENGNQRPITFATATEPEEFAALQAEIRSNYLRQFNNINPAVLNEFLFPEMRRTESTDATKWARERGDIIKEERRGLAVSDFANGSRDINDTYRTLVNSGVSPTEAKQTLIDLAADLYYNGKLTEEQYQAIKDAPFGPGRTWGDTNSRQFDEALDKARTARVESSRLDQAELQQAYDEESRAILATLQEGNYSREQIQTLIDGLKTKYIDKGARENELLKDFYNNSTVEGRSEQDAEDRLEGLYRSGDLTANELSSGRYEGLSTDRLDYWRQKAQQSEQLGANSNEMAAAAKPAQEALKNAIRDSIGNPLPGERVDPSASFAEAAAIGELNQKARQLRITEGLSWAQAYNKAGMELAAEITKGRDDENSQWYIDGSKTGDDNFPRFRSGATDTQQAAQTINGWKVKANEVGSDVFNDQSIFTASDAASLVNPNNNNDTQAELKLRTILNQINENGGRMTLTEARRMVLDQYGLSRERPLEPDELELSALDSGMLNELYSPYASGPNSVAVQANTAPPVIRTGVEGGRDVIQASVAFGAPTQLAPLAAAVMANETGWGKYTSGKNNLFNIKSTDGTGTVTTTREGDINGSGPSTTEQAQWRDYESGTESVRDFWEFLRSNERYAAVLTAATPMEALRELKAAGYATSPSYVQDVAATFETMGIDPNRPFQPQQLTPSPWGNTSTMSPTAANIIRGSNKNIIITSANDASGEPGSDFVVEGGQRGANFYFPYDSKVVAVNNDSNWETNLESNPNGQRGYGNYVDLQVTLPNGETADVRIAHMDNVADIQVGQNLPANALIGTQGRTGSTTGAHMSLDWYEPGTNTPNLAARDWFLNNYLQNA